MKLSINLNKIALLRNARGENHPFLLKAAKEVIKYGADSITIHVREDQRHVNKKDAILLKKKIKKPIKTALFPPNLSANKPNIGANKPQNNICIPIANPNAVLLIFKLSLKSIKNRPKTCLTPKEIKTTKHAANKVTIAVLDLKKFSEIILNVLMLV